MVDIDQELWRVIASGGFAVFLAKIQEFADIDTRARLLDDRDFLGWIRVELAENDSLAYAIAKTTLTAMWNLVHDRYYAPVLITQSPPMVENAASDGAGLSADNPPAGYTTYVYSFNGLKFAEVGTLTEHSAPSSGNYVLANKSDSDATQVSLPSSFLTIS